MTASVPKKTVMAMTNVLLNSTLTTFQRIWEAIMAIHAARTSSARTKPLLVRPARSSGFSFANAPGQFPPAEHSKKNFSATNEKPAQIVKFMSTSGASKTRFFGKIAGLNPGIKVSV
jgi:hypothetical protein